MGREPILCGVRDTDGDDKYDSVETLRTIKGDGEHGPQATIFSPDKRSLFVCAGNHTDKRRAEKSLIPRNWD